MCTLVSVLLLVLFPCANCFLISLQMCSVKISLFLFVSSYFFLQLLFMALYHIHRNRYPASSLFWLVVKLKCLEQTCPKSGAYLKCIIYGPPQTELIKCNFFVYLVLSAPWDATNRCITLLYTHTTTEKYVSITINMRHWYSAASLKFHVFQTAWPLCYFTVHMWIKSSFILSPLFLC